jgi:hypothetical protein
LTWAKRLPAIQILKIRPAKKWTIWGAFGPKFLIFFYTSSWSSEGSRRPNRADVTTIGQQNPPGRLKLLVLRGKNRQKYRFLIFQKKK